MPVRDKAVQALASALEGGVSYNNVTLVVYLGTPFSEGGRRVIDRDEYEERYGGAYEAMVDDLDWNRAFIEASQRHLALDHPDTDYGIICEECLNEALLCASWQDWMSNPRAPRRRSQ